MFRIVKRQDMSSRYSSALRIGSIFAALLFTALIIILLGYNPIQVYFKIVEGSLFSKFRITQTIHKMIPLITLSLGCAVAFKMKFWNIGAEGQFYLGALGATYIALNYGSLPPYILLPIMFLAGFICGALWALISALLRTAFGASETLVTLMLNYIATNIIMYLQYGPWKDPAARGFAKIARFSPNAWLPTIFGVQSGWIITVVLVILIYFMFAKTRLGYQIQVIGENTQTARYAGMNVNKILIIAVILSGGICGIAGMMQASGVEHSLTYELSAGLGFTAVITAWLARLDPLSIVVVSTLFSILLQGGTYIQTALQVPSSIAGIIQGVILFFVLASDFFVNYKIIRVKKENAGTAVPVSKGE
ncbi:MAG: ABC transporter permease [Clostridiales bacterium]|nr:ABC transporter permease [Clostridiales bacterium]